MKQAIQDFIKHKKIALIGLSHKKNKFGNYAYKELTARGYSLYPIHPTEKEIDGIRCYPNFPSINEKIDGVFVSVSGGKIIPILREIASAGIRNVWLQQGCESPESIEEAKGLGINLVSKKCILMYAEPVKSFHKFHRVISNLFTRS
ncbi:MAG: CoA-binding protein [Ignavibacteria bacterium]|nr:CoA-binding protein [Ignavibacteria bacterium]NCS81370.1 CoA-binding protein [Ignavibacteria bacterium]